MSKLTSTKSRVFSLIAAASLVSMTLVSIPSAHAADAVCATVHYVETCNGATSDGAKYQSMVPANFNGTVFLYSHGYRYPVDIPASFPAAAGGGYKVANYMFAQVGPSAAVVGSLLAKGYGVVGSGFSVQGWNADKGLATDAELIPLFKAKYTKTTKVVAWGESLGGFITQALAEKYPTLVDAVAPMCMAAGSVEAELTMAGDALWGLKTFFDPSIVGHNYKAGLAGYAEAMGDIAKILTIASKIPAAVATDKWLDTSGAAGVALAAIPPRSALLLVGLMSGVPTQSAHFDSTTGPGPVNSADYSKFALAASPALATLENIAGAAILGVLATYDVELQAGGTVFDNSKTDYASRITNEAASFNLALSGNSAIKGMMRFLATASVAPRWTADAASVANMRALVSHTGTINVPTIGLAATADATTPAGNLQWLADRAAEQLAASKVAAQAEYVKTGTFVSPKSKFLAIWNAPAASYTKFSGATPITSGPAANGTTHCNYTTAQYMAVAVLAAQAATTGAIPVGGGVKTIIRKAGGLAIDPNFRAPLLKFYNEQ